MIFQPKQIAVVLCLAGLIVEPAFAVTTHHKMVLKHKARTAKAAAPVASTTQHPASNQILPYDLDAPGQAIVTTGPYIGLPLHFNGDNLIINTPGVNTDVQLLNIRKAVTARLASQGLSHTGLHHSHLLLSGALEGQASYARWSGANTSTSNLALSNVALDAVFFGPSKWTLGMIELAYDDSAPTSIPGLISNYTPGNSRVYVNKAFVTVGDFTESPFYATFGQYFVPFGHYGSMMITAPMTKNLARTKIRGLTVGYRGQEDNAAYLAGFVFRGDSHASGVNKINNGGLDAGYHFRTDTMGGDVGGGLIANMADSVGMQVGTGLQISSAAETIVRRVPGYNARAMLNIGKRVDLIAEFVGATKRYSPNDMSYKGHGAQPNALDLEAAYSFKMLNESPSSLGIGYGHTSEALAMGLPQSRYSVVLNTSMWRNTLQAIEFRRDREYPASAVATGAAINAGALPATQTGRFDNVVTAQFDYFF